MLCCHEESGSPGHRSVTLPFIPSLAFSNIISRGLIVYSPLGTAVKLPGLASDIRRIMHVDMRTFVGVRICCQMQLVQRELGCSDLPSQKTW